jgi:hypothetical protein
MTQSRLGSFIEAWVNVFIGYTINFTANLLIFPLFGWDISIKQNLILGLIFTVISVARSYAIRRWFNKYIHNAAQKLGGAHGTRI